MSFKIQPHVYDTLPERTPQEDVALAAANWTNVNLHSKLTHRDHLKMTHPGGSKAHRRAAPI